MWIQPFEVCMYDFLIKFNKQKKTIYFFLFLESAVKFQSFWETFIFTQVFNVSEKCLFQLFSFKVPVLSSYLIFHF